MCTNISPPPSSNVALFLEHTGPVFGAHNLVQRYPSPPVHIASFPPWCRKSDTLSWLAGSRSRRSDKMGVKPRCSATGFPIIFAFNWTIVRWNQNYTRGALAFYDSRIGSLLFSAWRKKAKGRSMMSTPAKHHKKRSIRICFH